MVEIGTQTDSTTKLSAKDFPKNSLGRVFPDFESFWKELKPRLGFVVFKIIRKVEEKDGKEVRVADFVESDKRGLTYRDSEFGLGILARFVGEIFYLKFRSREYVGEQREFIDEFIAELTLIIAEIRRKEWIWTQLYLDVNKWTKLDRTEIEKTTGSDKGGKTTSGDASNYQVLSKELADKKIQHGTVSSFDQKGGTTTIIHKGVNYMPLGKILGALNNLQINFSEFYPRFEHLWNHYTAPTLKYVIDKTTGGRIWVTEKEYEDIVEPDKPKPKKIGADPYELLAEYEKTKDWAKYLEALKAYRDQNEKEWVVLPDSSNRKNRIERRVKIATGCLKAYEQEVNLPSSRLFRDRMAGKVEGFNKVVGYENIIDMVADYLDEWEYVKKWGGNKPEQLMIGMLGDPGLGKSYISEAIGNALGDGKRLSYHRVLMTGKKDSSVIEGSSMENPGGDPGEILKGISRCQNQSMTFLFDEIEKAERAAKLAIGEPTDRTNNKKFKDIYFDFPTPINNAIFFCALNYAEELDPFIRDRFKMIEVKPPTYQQRLEILRALLQSKIKSEEEPLNKIYHKTWQEVYNLVNQEVILKKALTWTLSIRGAKDNITTLFRNMRTQFFMKQKPLLSASEWVNYDFKFEPKEEFDLGNKSRGRPPCPWGEEKNRTGTSDKEHRRGCKCFVNNLDRVPGWKENMGTS